MSSRSLSVAVAMYRGGALTLSEAADRECVSRSRMETALRARGITVREAGEPVDPAGS